MAPTPRNAYINHERAEKKVVETEYKPKRYKHQYSSGLDSDRTNMFQFWTSGSCSAKPSRDESVQLHGRRADQAAEMELKHTRYVRIV